MIMPKRFSLPLINKFFSSRTLIAFLTIALITVSLIMWQAQESHSLALLAESTSSKSQSLAAETQFNYQTVYQSLEQLAADPTQISQTWEYQAAFLLDQFPALLRITWVDDDLRIQNGVPARIHEVLIGSSVINIPVNDDDITLRFPGAEQGQLVGILNLEKLILMSAENLEPEFIIRASLQGDPLFTTAPLSPEVNDFIAAHAVELDQAGELELSLAPSGGLVQSTQVNARQILWLGLGFSSFALISVFVAQLSFRRANENQTSYQQVYDSSQDAIFITDLDGDLFEVNPATCDLIGYTKEELIGMNITDLVADTGENTLDKFRGLLEWDGAAWEVLRHKDGHPLTVELTLSPLLGQGKQKKVMGIARDISKRKHTEKLIQIRLGIIEIANAGSFADVLQKTIDEACNLTDSPIGFLHLLSSNENTITQQAWSTRTTSEYCSAEDIDFHFPIDQAGVWAECMQTRAAVIHNDYKSLPNKKGLPEGHAPLTRELVVPVIKNKIIVAVIGVGNKTLKYTAEDTKSIDYLADVCWEVIERKRIEIDKVRQQALLTAIYDHTPLIMYLVDDQHRIQQVSGYTAKYLETTPEKLIDMPGGEALRCLNALNSASGCGFGDHCHQCTLRNTVQATLEMNTAFQQVEVNLPTSVSGQERISHFLLSSAPLWVDDHPMAMVTLLDITERAQSEQHTQNLLNRQKLINQLTMIIGKSLKVDAIYQVLAQHLQKIMPIDAFMIYTFDPHQNVLFPEFILRDSTIIPPGDSSSVSLKTNPQPCFEKVIHTGQPHYQPNLSTASVPNKKNSQHQHNSRTCFCTPLQVLGDVIGLIQIESKYKNAFNQADRDLVTVIASVAATAIQNIRLIDSLEVMIDQRTKELQEKIHKLDRSQKAMLFMVEDLNQTTASLKQERMLLNQANQELEAFSYSVSHDLRAPLRHINGYIELLTNRYTDTLPEKARHYFDSIVESAAEMGELIDSLLQFSKTSRQEMHFTQVDMNDMIQEVLINLKPDYEGREIQWVIASLPVVRGDRYLLKLVWANLISNALKYTQKGEQPRIKIGYYEDRQYYVFYIQDNGIGFDMKYAYKLFSVFQRLHAPDEYEGIGIGLANLRRIVQRHGGRTWAEGEPDQSATFYFSLPK